MIKANEESLVRQSRSFAIPILKLDGRFKIPVMVQYNINKAIDTIEDSTGLDAQEKQDLIRSFCDHLEEARASSEVKERMLRVTPPGEAFVFKNCEATIALYNTLSSEEKELSRKWTLEMAKGMCEFLTRPIIDQKDLNQYCYYVAGTVGLYLTDLLNLKGRNMSDMVYGVLRRKAVPFGLFLQKLNVIRDFVEDQVTRKRSFWPRTTFAPGGDKVDALNRMISETMENDVPHAIGYFSAIPAGNDSYDYFIRFILSSGLEYVAILRNNASVFSGAQVKLPKHLILDLYEKVSSWTREGFAAYCKELYLREVSHS